MQDDYIILSTDTANIVNTSAWKS